MADVETLRAQNEHLDRLVLLQLRTGSPSSASIEKKLALIEMCVADLRDAHANLLETDERERIFILYALQSAIVAAIATAFEIGAVEGAPEPATHGDAFLLLAERGVIPRRIADSLAGLASIRNAIAFDYLDLDLARIRHALEHDLDDLLSFVAAIRPLL